MEPTLTEPIGLRSLPFPFPGSKKPNVCLPSRLLSIVHERAKVSSVWPVRMSSQSLERIGEYEMEVIGGNFKEATGIDSEVAFFTREPIGMLNKATKR